MNKVYKKIYSAGVLGLFLGAVFACSEEEPINLAPTFEMSEATSIMRTSAVLSGKIMGAVDQVTSHGFEYSLSEDFTANLTTQVKVGERPTSHYNAEIKGLEANERYYYRMYASSGASTVYSASQYFQTAASSVPVMSALVVDSIGEDMARFKCTIEEIGDEYLIEYGVGYKTASDRTYYQVPSDSIIPFSIAGAENTFYIEITGLESATRYSFRPYAKNSADANGDSGTREGYGDIVERQTANKLSAMVTTSEIMEGQVGINSVTVSGMVQSADGSGGKIDKCGFCWSATSMTPSIADSHMEVKVTGVGEYFSATIPDLQPGRTYYVRAYAQNTVDGVAMVGYGDVYEFTTTNLITPEIEWVASTDKVTPTTISVRANIKNYDGTALVEKGIIWDKTRAQITVEDARKNNTLIKVTDGENLIDATITNLELNTGYYVRAYAIYQAAGLEEIGYTNYLNLWTEGFERPNFDNIDVMDVTYKSAKALARVNSKGNGTILERGFCVSMDKNTDTPTLANCDLKVMSDETFISKLENLIPGTRYSVRPYIISQLESAMDTTYCWSNTFRTDDFPMSWDWENEQIERTSAKLSVTFESLDGFEVVEKGFCCRLITDDNYMNATLENCFSKIVVNDGDEKGFSGTMTGLLPDSWYTFSAYIIFKMGDDEFVNYSNRGGTWMGTFDYNLDAQATSCKITGLVTDDIPDGISEYGFLWSTEDVEASQMKNQIKASGPNENGEFTATLESLKVGTEYWFRFYYVYNGIKYYGIHSHWFMTKKMPDYNDNPSPEIKK